MASTFGSSASASRSSGARSGRWIGLHDRRLAQEALRRPGTALGLDLDGRAFGRARLRRHADPRALAESGLHACALRIRGRSRGRSLMSLGQVCGRRYRVGIALPWIGCVRGYLGGGGCWVESGCGRVLGRQRLGRGRFRRQRRVAFLIEEAGHAVAGAGRESRAREEERREREARGKPSRGDPDLLLPSLRRHDQLLALPSHYGAQERQRSREEERVEEALPRSVCPLWHCLAPFVRAPRPPHRRGSLNRHPRPQRNRDDYRPPKRRPLTKRGDRVRGSLDRGITGHPVLGDERDRLSQQAARPRRRRSWRFHQRGQTIRPEFFRLFTRISLFTRMAPKP